MTAPVRLGIAGGPIVMGILIKFGDLCTFHILYDSQCRFTFVNWVFRFISVVWD